MPANSYALVMNPFRILSIFFPLKYSAEGYNFLYDMRGFVPDLSKDQILVLLLVKIEFSK